jgi:uncharacterized protein DUF1707/cell wall-active antibiotic response 4TMS protein YvqF
VLLGDSRTAGFGATPPRPGRRYGSGIADPDEQAPPILASDAERERGVELLREAVAEGRLTLEEFSDRVGAAQVARTGRDLAILTRDLPSPPASGAPGRAELPARARHRAAFSRLVRRGPWELAQRSSFQSIFGTIVLDLREARLAAAEVEVEIFNLFGTVTVIVPEGIVVSVEGGGWFASQVIDTPTVTAVAGAPVLRIRATGPGGTLYVRTHEPAPKTFRQTLGMGGD